MKPIPQKPAFSPTSPFWLAARENYRDLRALGFGNPLTIGILANFEMESGFLTTAVGDNGLSFNEEQWQAARIARILAATGINVVTERSIPNIVKACWWELNNVEPYKDALPALRAAQTAEQAAALFATHIEGAGAPEAAQRRAADAAVFTRIIALNRDFFSAAA